MQTEANLKAKYKINKVLGATNGSYKINYYLLIGLNLNETNNKMINY